MVLILDFVAETCLCGRRSGRSEPSHGIGIKHWQAATAAECIEKIHDPFGGETELFSNGVQVVRKARRFAAWTVGRISVVLVPITQVCDGMGEVNVQSFRRREIIE